MFTHCDILVSFCFPWAAIFKTHCNTLHLTLQHTLCHTQWFSFFFDEQPFSDSRVAVSKSYVLPDGAILDTGALLCVAVCCSVLQCFAVFCRMCVASMLQVCWSALQICGVLQYVAVCCGVLHCFTRWHHVRFLFMRDTYRWVVQMSRTLSKRRELDLDVTNPI